MKNFLKEKRNYIIVFFLTVFVHALNLTRAGRYELRMDDFGPLIYPAWLAGFDWTELTTNIPNYYGYGYYWIFAPIFRLCNSARNLIMSITFINILMLALVAMLIYHISVNYFKMEKKWYTIGLSAVVTFFVRNVPMASSMDEFRTDNEVPLFIGCWLFVWILLLIQKYEQKSKKLVFSVLLALNTVWILTVHERGMSILFAFIIAIIIIAVCGRKLIVEPISYFAIVAVGYKIHKMVQGNIITYFHAAASANNMKNTSATKSIGLWFTDSLLAVKSYAIMVFGNLHEIVLVTGGVFVIALAILTIWIAKNRPWNKERCREVDDRIVVLGTFVLAVLIVTVGIGMNWGDNLYAGLLEDKTVYAYKGISYLRYYFSLTSVVTVAGVSLLNTEYTKEKATKITTLIYYVIFEGVFVAIAFPLIKGDGNYLRRAGGYILFKERPFLNLAFSMVIVFMLIVLFFWDKKKYTKHSVVAYISLALLVPIILNIKFGRLRFEIEDIKEIAVLYEKLEEVDKNYRDNMYVSIKDLRDTRAQLVDKSIRIKSVTEKYDIDGILLSTKKVSELDKLGYINIKVGNFYAYTNRQEYVKAFKMYEQ